jgi:hypothetical protein
MKLKFLIIRFTLIAGTGLIASSALASNTRVRSMGDVGLILRDDSNLWLFPSTVMHYRNLAILELGGRRELIYYLPNQAGIDPGGGGLIRLGGSGRHVIGGFVGESSERLPFAPLDPTTGQPLAMNRKIDLFYGVKNANSGLGWQLTYASGAHKSSSSSGVLGAIENKASVRLLGLSFGMTHSFATGGTLDLALRYENHGFEVTRTSGMAENSRGGHHLELLSRWTKGIKGGMEIVPFAGAKVGSDGRDLGQGIGSQSTDLAQNRILAGTGFNFRPDSNSVFSLGLSFFRSQETTTTDVGSSATKLTQVTWRLPFVFGGVETALFDWLRVRFGFQKALQTLSRETRGTGLASNNDSEDTRSEGPFELAFGLGIHHRSLTIDFSLDPNYFKRGVYVLSGSQGNMFNLVTVTYGFE